MERADRRIRTTDRSSPARRASFDDKVVIGFGGGDFGPVRGYVTAYDTSDRQAALALLHGAWRSGASGFENPAMELAAKT